MKTYEGTVIAGGWDNRPYQAGIYEAKSETEGQEQTRLRSPWTASMRETVGQYLEVRAQGAGKAAFSRV